MPVSFRVNGSPITVDVPSDMPLLWVLRDVLDLKGTKFGCGISQCGACTVHVDGAPTRSCRTRVGTVEGQEITTIEGLSPDGAHALQEAWRELDVPQCGYCQAGQLMAAAGLLAENPNPTDEDIDTALQRNLCRCGTYLRIREGIKQAARAMAEDPDGSGRGGAPSRPSRNGAPSNDAAPSRNGATSPSMKGSPSSSSNGRA